MAIVVGDVVELGLTDSNGGVQKVLGVVEQDDGDTLRVLTGCLPYPTRDVPRISLRRVWGSSQVNWSGENSTEVSSVTHTIQRRARRKALGTTDSSSSATALHRATRPGVVSSSDDLDDEQDGGWSFDSVSTSAARPRRPLHTNPLRLVCAVCEDLCSWQHQAQSAAFLVSLSLLWLTNAIAGASGSSRTATLLVALTVQPIATVLLVFALFTARPSSKCSPLWLVVLLAVLGTMWACNSAALGVPVLLFCCIGGLGVRQVHAFL